VTRSDTRDDTRDVLNRSVGRMHIFRKQADFEAFERVIVETHERQPIRILSYRGLERTVRPEGRPRKASQ
jgi:hypothetical protein